MSDYAPRPIAFSPRFTFDCRDRDAVMLLDHTGEALDLGTLTEMNQRARELGMTNEDWIAIRVLTEDRQRVHDSIFQVGHREETAVARLHREAEQPKPAYTNGHAGNGNGMNGSAH